MSDEERGKHRGKRILGLGNSKGKAPKVGRLMNNRPTRKSVLLAYRRLMKGV